MRLITLRLVVSLALCTSSLLAHAAANTVIAVKTGRWTSIDTWSCLCLPKRTDSIIIPQGVIVSVVEPLILGPSEDGKALNISIAGTLNISMGSIHLDPLDRVIVLPGGKVSSKSFGGMIFSGIYALLLEGGTVVRGPATLGDGYSPLAISAIMAEYSADEVTVSWRSCSEIEVNYYFISRSVDGVNFVPLGKIDGRGSRKERVFSFIDKSHSTGIVYYRIDLTNMNGVGSTAATANLEIGNTDGTFTPIVSSAPGHK